MKREMMLGLTVMALAASVSEMGCTAAGDAASGGKSGSVAIPGGTPAQPMAGNSAVNSADVAAKAVSLIPSTDPFPTPPAGFDRLRQNIPHGKLEQINYDSKAVKGTRRVDVWTPPDYSPAKKYPLLILLHGAGGNETHEWTGKGATQGQANVILDNLYADKKIAAMVVIFPNGNANDTSTPGTGVEGAPAGAGGRGGAPGGAGGPGGGPGGAFGPNSGWTNFASNDLLKDLVPFMESHYSLYTDADHQALAGLSMGGMQTRTVVTANLDRFGYVGVFSGGNLQPENITDLAKFKKANRLTFMSFGSKESSAPRGGVGGPSGPQGIQLATVALKKVDVDAVYYVSPNSAHDMTSWKRSLYYFSQMLFLDLPKP